MNLFGILEYCSSSSNKNVRKDDEYFESAPRWKSWCLGKVSLGPGALKLKTKTKSSKERRFLDSWLYVCESISIPFMERLPAAISRSSTLITQSKNTWFIFSSRNTISQLTCLSAGAGAGVEQQHGRPVGLLIWNAFSAPPSLRDVLKVLRTPFCAGVY